MSDIDRMLMVTLISCVFSFVAFVGCLIYGFKVRKMDKRLHNTALELRGEVTGIDRNLESAEKRWQDQACRVAWLETKVRANNNILSNNLNSAAPTPEISSSDHRPSVTERRHRILSLSRRGMDTNAISNLIGAHHGEIELIVGLSKMA